MLIQLPIMIALFRMLQSPKSFDLAAGAKANFWIVVPDLTTTLKSAAGGSLGALSSNLAVALPYLILLVLFVVTTYLPQKMMSQDPQQNRMMVIMSVMMVWIGWTIPAGVILYWVTSNVFMLIQQYVMLRALPTQGGEDDGKK